MSKINKEDYLIYQTRFFDQDAKVEFRKRNTEGYKPYYFDKKDYDLKEIELTSQFLPKTGGKSRHYGGAPTNEYGVILFLKGDGVDIIEKMSKSIGGMIRAGEKKNKLLLRYIPSVVKDLGETGGKNIEPMP